MPGIDQQLFAGRGGGLHQNLGGGAFMDIAAGFIMSLQARLTGEQSHAAAGQTAFKQGRTDGGDCSFDQGLLIADFAFGAAAAPYHSRAAAQTSDARAADHRLPFIGAAGKAPLQRGDLAFYGGDFALGRQDAKAAGIEPSQFALSPTFGWDAVESMPGRLTQDLSAGNQCQIFQRRFLFIQQAGRLQIDQRKILHTAVGALGGDDLL